MDEDRAQKSGKTVRIAGFKEESVLASLFMEERQIGHKDWLGHGHCFHQLEWWNEGTDFIGLSGQTDDAPGIKVFAGVFWRDPAKEGHHLFQMQTLCQSLQLAPRISIADNFQTKQWEWRSRGSRFPGGLQKMQSL